MGSASPKAKTLNVKVLSHANPLISNDFSCNRGNPDGVGAAGGIERGAWGWNGSAFAFAAANVYGVIWRHAGCAVASLRLRKTPSAMTNEIVRDAKVALRGLPPHGVLR
jgi:hypothetical protein